VYYLSSEGLGANNLVYTSNLQVGSVIGKAGSVIKALREETGAKIKVLDAVVGCEDRVVLIAGIDDPSAPFSTAQVVIVIVC
jgi:poly(rC)-binding protein 2/3/4